MSGTNTTENMYCEIMKVCSGQRIADIAPAISTAMVDFAKSIGMDKAQFMALMGSSWDVAEEQEQVKH